MRQSEWTRIFDEVDRVIERRCSTPAPEALESASEARSPEETAPLNKRAEVLRKAEDLINGERAQTYGPIEISFQRHADIWNAMGYRRLVPEEQEIADGFDSKKVIAYRAEMLDAIDAVMILEGLKMSRAVGNHGSHPDDWVDKAGYAGIGAELAERETNDS